MPRVFGQKEDGGRQPEFAWGAAGFAKPREPGKGPIYPPSRHPNLLRPECVAGMLRLCFNSPSEGPGHGRPGPTVAPRPVDAVVFGTWPGAAGGLRVEAADGSVASGAIGTA